MTDHDKHTLPIDDDEPLRPFEMSADAKHAQALSNKPKPTPDHSQDAPDRTISNRPRDPNGAGAQASIPPGVDADIARDPGANTPSSPPARK